MKKIICSILGVILVVVLIALKCCTTSTTSFETIVSEDYYSVMKNYGDTSSFFEVRAYMPERIDSAAAYKTQIDSLVTIFAINGNTRVIYINHKIIGNKVITDTAFYRGPFVEDCEMPWPLPVTFDQMMDTVVAKKLSAPKTDIVLRRGLILHPKDYPDFTIYSGEGFWWFISTENCAVRDTL